jgi:hypothetical protein
MNKFIVKPNFSVKEIVSISKTAKGVVNSCQETDRILIQLQKAHSPWNQTGGFNG